MSYMHIENLYKNQTVLLFKECFALEKIHGTSANIAYRDGRVFLSSGGESASRFAALFDQAALQASFESVGYPNVVVYGEAYGGSQQKQAWRYGEKLRFVAFEVKIGDHWLAVPQAFDFVTVTMKLEFVPYFRIPAEIAAIDAERDAPSIQAFRNGVAGPVPREGVVLRPLVEATLNNGDRIIAKHKRDDERETASPRAVVDPTRQVVLEQASAIAAEWVTPTRLEHVLDKLQAGIGIEQTRMVIAAMTEDVLREGAGEIVDSAEARRAIGTRTAKLFKARLESVLHAS